MDKNAIRQKHKNKSKYNRGYKQIVTEEKAVELADNSSRYEESANADETANFDMLSKEPTSNHSFFKFKSEQGWDDGAQAQLPLSNHFTLDLTLLSEGIVCVPFAKRQDMDESLFSCTDNEHTNKNVERNVQNYTKYVNKRFPQKTPNRYVVEEHTEVIKPAVVDTRTVLEKPASVDTEATEESFIIQKKPEEETSSVMHEKPEPFVEPVISDAKTVEIKPTEDTKLQLESKETLLNETSCTKLQLESKETRLNDTSCTEKVDVAGEEKRKDKYQDDMDELLNLKKPEGTVDPLDFDVTAEDPLTAVTVPKTAATNTAVDLEQWLDDILDD